MRVTSIGLSASVPFHHARARHAPVPRAATTGENPVQSIPITLSNNAVSHLQKLKAEKNNDDLMLRIGVRSGGCSGMSYAMDFEDGSNVGEEDVVTDCEGVKLVCDPKSLLYLFGMELDYSDALVGGGFKFNNPNAESTCGCGKSFGI